MVDVSCEVIAFRIFASGPAVEQPGARGLSLFNVYIPASNGLVFDIFHNMRRSWDEALLVNPEKTSGSPCGFRDFLAAVAKWPIISWYLDQSPASRNHWGVSHYMILLFVLLIFCKSPQLFTPPVPKKSWRAPGHHDSSPTGGGPQWTKQVHFWHAPRDRSSSNPATELGRWG